MFVTKYSASGNDFVILHSFKKKDRSELARKLCNRHEGIGADGMVVVLPHSQYDFEWEFYNSDGSIALMCGNASRAVAHYAVSQDLADATMQFLTGAGVIKASVEKDFVTSNFPLAKVIEIAIQEGTQQWSLIDTGVPHLVSFVESIENFNLKQAKALREKYNANVNIWTSSGDEIFVRTYERGVEDETLACGTGMAACFLQGIAMNKIPTKIAAIPKSGQKLYFEFNGGAIRFGGKVKALFTTVVDKDFG